MLLFILFVCHLIEFRSKYFYTFSSKYNTLYYSILVLLNLFLYSFPSIVTLANKFPINYTASDFNAFKNNGQKGIAYCLHSARAYNITRFCYGSEVIFPCNGKVKGFYTYNCSSLTQVNKY